MNVFALKKKSKAAGSKVEAMTSKDNLKSAGADLGIGLLIATSGSVIATMMGRPSAAIGLVATAAGAMIQNPIVTAAGLSLVAAGIVQPKNSEPVEGLDVTGRLDRAKNRFENFKKAFMHNTFLSSLTEKKGPETPTDEELDGLGLPENMPLDTSAIDNIEQQIISSAMKFQAEQATEGNDIEESSFDPDLEGFGEFDEIAMEDLSMI
jgi:hypothetical protein